MEKHTARVVLLSVVVLSSTVAVLTPPLPGTTAGAAPTGSAAAPASGFVNESVTVVTTQGRGTPTFAHIAAVNESGATLYRHSEYTTYHDVDPSPRGRWNVTYVAAQFARKGPCETERCIKNYIVSVNLSTGRREVLYASWYPKWNKWHDVDRVNRTHFIVADIANDRVVMIDVSSFDPAQRTGFQYRDDVVWSWSAADHYPPPGESGGPPDDWTHVNDVEVLADGRIMASIRNHDQVVFIEPGHGVQENWTLGADDDHGTLYEQHNPDYIPAACGGPAVIVADSENNRVVEYHREGGRWNRTWAWSDPLLQWPRDADRLPSGNTLVTDTNGDRVIEVSPSGEVVWSLRVERPYEAERLGTGPESTGGPAINGTPAEGCERSTASSRGVRLAEGGFLDGWGVLDPIASATKLLLPAKVLSGLMFWAPVWLSVVDLPFLALALLSVVAWLVAEARWR